ncbi:MAG: PQQ-binding-like beta-propeller repeat protein [Verrucomicrobiota bacterium]
MEPETADTLPEQPSREVWRGLLLALTVTSGVFTLAVVIVLTANVLAAQSVDPLAPTAVPELRELLRKQPDNEQLRKTIREIDWRSRQRFFYHQAILTTGVRLALGGGVLFLAGLHLLTVNRRRHKRKDGIPEGEEARRAEQRRSLLISLGTVGVVLAVLALVPVEQFIMKPHRNTAISELPPPSTSQPSQTATQTTEDETDEREDTEAADRELPEQPLHWPAFRGPDGLGVAEVEAPPTKWDGETEEGIVWKTAVPRPGYSSPIVVGDGVYLTGADEEKREVFCFDAATGELRWRADTEGVDGTPDELPEVTEDTGYAAPTMTSDGARVFAIFATGTILGLDLDGNRLWGRNLGVPENHYGHSSSLLMADGKLIVQYDHFGGSRLLALDPVSGQTVWTTKRQNAGISWSSPVRIPVGEKGQIILCADPTVAAYKPSDGAQAWSSEVLSGEIGVSPAYADGVVYEGNEFAVLAALQAEPTDAREPGEVLWESYDNLPNVSSPVVANRRLYMGNSYGTFACLDVDDGSTVWTHDFDAGFYASPILAGGAIYTITMKGTTIIIEPGDSFEQIQRNELGESVVTTPAFAKQKMYLRASEHLYAIGKNSQPEN